MGFLANLLVFSALFFPSSASSSPKDAGLRRRFQQWMVQYERVYNDDDEKEQRFQIFNKNVAYIEDHNNNKEMTYSLGVNMFTDLTLEEFSAIYARCRQRRSPVGVVKGKFKYENVTNIPTSVDWRQNRAVSNVKHQGVCGSCWAFSAAAAVEGIMKIAKGHIMDLSAQQLLDCVHSGSCDIGYLPDTFNYIEEEGLAPTRTYPYTGVKETCNTSIVSVAFTKGYEEVPVDELALKRAVAHQPVAAVVDSRSDSFRHYTGGVYQGPCGTDPDHSVAVVGYGVDPDGINFWLLKNSWGTQWGERGYMRLKRMVNDETGLCAIAADAYYPIV